jgi:hypothetical protein
MTNPCEAKWKALERTKQIFFSERGDTRVLTADLMRQVFEYLIEDIRAVNAAEAASMVFKPDPATAQFMTDSYARSHGNTIYEAKQNAAPACDGQGVIPVASRDSNTHGVSAAALSMQDTQRILRSKAPVPMKGFEKFDPPASQNHSHSLRSALSPTTTSLVGITSLRLARTLHST